MKATMLDGPGNVRVETGPSDDLEAHRPIIRIFCGLRVRGPGASNATELPASDKETLSGWRDLTRDPLTPSYRHRVRGRTPVSGNPYL